MMKRLAVLAALAFAAPALAVEATPMSDAELNGVAAGTGSLAPLNINVNASPIILTQTAVALNFQTQSFAMGSKGKGKAWGHAKQSGFAAASNTAKINYHVVQVNAGG